MKPVAYEIVAVTRRIVMVYSSLLSWVPEKKKLCIGLIGIVGFKYIF